jgi:hypothetical protein
LRADLTLEFGHMHGLDRALGADGHEDGRFDHAMVGRDASRACLGSAVRLDHFKIHGGKSKVW